MCTGYEPYAIMALATAAGAANQQRTLKKQDRAAAAGIRSQAAGRREAASKVNERIAELDRANPQDVARGRLAEYMTALRRNQPSAEGSLPDVAGASSRFDTDVAAARADTRGEAETTAGRLSRMDAPGIQRQGESIRTAELARDIGEIGRQSGAQDYLTRLKIRGIRANPWIDAIASLGQGYAIGKAGKPAATGGSKDIGSLYGRGQFPASIFGP